MWLQNAYIEYKEITAAQGVKIAAKDLEKAVAGLNLLVAHKPDEIDILRLACIGGGFIDILVVLVIMNSI